MCRMRDITVRELATITIEQLILENIQNTDFSCLLKDLVQARLNEISLTDSKISYDVDCEALTCEISNNKVYVVKHPNIDKAIDYYLNSFSEMSIIQGNSFIAIEQYDNTLYWTVTDSKKLIKIRGE